LANRIQKLLEKGNIKLVSLANNSSEQKWLCCNAFISVMKAAELWNCDNLSNLQRLSRKWTLFTEA
jgi:hypothetical protein